MVSTFKNGSSLTIMVLAGIMMLVFGIGMVSAAETKTITDIEGNSVTVPAEITHAVTIDPFTSQFLYVIRADTQLAGTCIGPANRNRVNVTEKTLASLPNAGCKDNLNIETLFTLKPDVVISSVDYAKANDQIKTTGTPLVLVDFETPDNLMETYRILGELFGKKEKADEFISYYNSRMDMIRSVVANQTSDRKRSVYFAQRDALQTLGDDYYEAQMAAVAGAENVATQLSGGDNKVTIDQIYTWNPDTIILLPYCPQSVSDILADPAWASLDAVRNRQVYRMPKYLMTWELPTPEAILGTMWMAKTLYPDTVSFDLEKEIQDFYQKFYNIDLSSDGVQDILSDQSLAQLNKPV